ncbi:MAG: hypothetical protein JXA22_07370 [Candidatus Thermoplasmatota archaeon]|nr:hypothetical protein [Candidatus Thermoplasmatota archaeon]
MAEEKDVKLPLGLVKNIFTLLMIAGILLYVAWTILMIVTKGIFFDLGLYSVCIIMVLMGLAGRLLYSHKQKTEA